MDDSLTYDRVFRLQEVGSVGVAGFRVTVRSKSGTIIGLAHVGEGDEALTFPAHYHVGDALHTDNHWIRRATPEDGTKNPYVHLAPDENPKSLVYENGKVASSDYPIGFGGPEVVAYNFVITALIDVSAPDIDVSGIKTPPSPPMELD